MVRIRVVLPDAKGPVTTILTGRRDSMSAARWAVRVQSLARATVTGAPACLYRWHGSAFARAHHQARSGCLRFWRGGALEPFNAIDETMDQAPIDVVVVLYPTLRTRGSDLITPRERTWIVVTEETRQFPHYDCPINLG
jgi:hypothetical protein